MPSRNTLHGRGVGSKFWIEGRGAARQLDPSVFDKTIKIRFTNRMFGAPEDPLFASGYATTSSISHFGLVATKFHKTLKLD